MLNFLNNKNNKNELKENNKRYGRKVDEQGRYVETLEHIRGNAAIGEQVHSARTFKTDKPMTFEEMKLHWDEMNREAKEWLETNPGQSANFITSQDTNGNEILRVVPAKDLIFSGSNLVAVYDENGNKIVGKDNIIREVQQRRAKRDKWIREGKMENIFDEIHHTDDGWTSNVRFAAYPGQLHPNEVRDENERLLRIAEERSKNDKKKNRFLGDGINSDTEETSENSSKRSRTKEGEIPTLMDVDIDQLETSTSKGQNIELEKMSKDKLISLREQINKELESREKGEEVSNDFKEVSTQNLKEQSQKLERALNNLSTSPNNLSQPSSILPAVGLVGIVSLLTGGLVFWKKSKSK